MNFIAKHVTMNLRNWSFIPPKKLPALNVIARGFIG